MHFTKPELQFRNWGSETTIIRTPTHAGKLLRRQAGTKGGFQCHVKEESHYLVDGMIALEWIEHGTLHQQDVMAGSAWTVPPLTFHRETALTDCLLIEVSDPTTNDRYGLVPDPGALPSMTDMEAAAICDQLAAELESRAVVCRATATIVLRDGLKGLAPQVEVPA